MTLNVLVVDDDASLRRLASAVLVRNKMDVDVAKDGIEALEMVAAKEYDVIVLDLMMPRMTGLQVLEYFSRNNETQIPKTLVVSATSGPEWIEAQNYNVYRTVPKPYDIQNLAAMVAECATRN